MKLLCCFRPYGLLPDPTQELREKIEKNLKQLKASVKAIELAKRLITEKEYRCSEMRQLHLKLDRQLALKDGRYQKLKPHEPKDKVPPTPEQLEKVQKTQQLMKWIGTLSAEDKKKLLEKLTN